MNNELNRLQVLAGIPASNKETGKQGNEKVTLSEAAIDHVEDVPGEENGLVTEYAQTPDDKFFELHPLIRRELYDFGASSMSNEDILVLYRTIDAAGGFEYDTSPEEYSEKGKMLNAVRLDPVAFQHAVNQLGLQSQITEHTVGDLNNGYDLQHEIPKSDDYFPSGADSNVTDEAGPASAKQGDNPLQKSESNAIHEELVYKYRKFLSK